LCEDPDSSALRTELEFLRLRADGLAKCVAAERGEAAMVSDFWLDQGLVYARRRLDTRSLDVFERAWQAARREVVQPKLLVLLDATPEGAKTANGTRAGATRERPDALRWALAECAASPGRGPLLKLDASDFEWAVAETSAALRAMREFPQ
jgi:hypothetical protein